MKAKLFALLARISPWLHRVLCEDNGNPSAVRFFAFCWHLPAALVWTGLSIYHGHMEPIPDGVGFLLGGLTGLKVGQKFAETKVDPAA